MKVVLEPKVLTQIAAASADAAWKGDVIRHIELSRTEWERLQREAGANVESGSRKSPEYAGQYLGVCCGIRLHADESFKG